MLSCFGLSWLAFASIDLANFSLQSWILLGQEEAAGGGGAFDILFRGPWVPFLMIGVLFYMLMIRPERRKRADLALMLGNLKKNDRIVTIGGIFGTVVNVQQGVEEVTIKVDEGSNVKLRVQRSAIARVVNLDGTASNKTAS